MIVLQLYSRQGCHLCEQLLTDLEPIVRGRAEVRIVDVDLDPALAAKYGLRVPVLTGNGEELSEYPLDAARVRRFLDAA